MVSFCCLDILISSFSLQIRKDCDFHKIYWMFINMKFFGISEFYSGESDLDVVD